MTPDADFLDFDWTPQAQKNQFLCVLFHGLEGNSQSHYARAFTTHMQQMGGAVCMPHFRGCSGEINLAPRAYHSGDYEEVDWILKQIKLEYAGPMWAVGVSLGANALLRWAQEAGERAATLVRGVAAICAPLDLMQSGLQIGRGINHYIYERRFLKTMKEKARQKFAQYPGLFNLSLMQQSQSLYDFDNEFTAPLHGFKDTNEYWTKCSSIGRLKEIKIKHLVINAFNDPFIPAGSLPKKSDFNDHATVVQTSQGGHVGYPLGQIKGCLGALPELVNVWMKS
jgi:uncharacterized protein